MMTVSSYEVLFIYSTYCCPLLLWANSQFSCDLDPRTHLPTRNQVDCFSPLSIECPQFFLCQGSLTVALGTEPRPAEGGAKKIISRKAKQQGRAMLDTNVELSWGTFWQIVVITVYSLQTKTVPWEEHLAPLRQSLL